MTTVDDVALGAVRLDVWLDVACLFKTRSEAQRACRGGKVDVNEQRAKPHRTIATGDRLSISRTQGRLQQVVVLTLALCQLNYLPLVGLRRVEASDPVVEVVA